MNKVEKLQDRVSRELELTASITAENLVKRFFEFLDVSEQTGRAYKFGIKQFIRYLHSENIPQPTRETVITYKKSLIAKGLKPSTIALYLSSIRRFFSWCETEKLYENITSGIKSPKQPSGHKRDYLTGSQIHAMLKRVHSKRDYAMLALISTCGLRTIEVVRANVSDFRTISGVSVLDIQGKGHSDKDVFVKLSQPVVDALNEYLTERGNVKGNEPLFVSESRRNAGERLTTRTVSGIAKKAMKEAGCNSPRLTAHSLRHSAATLALLSGQKLEDVQQFLRHTSVTTTMIYAHTLNRLNSQCENAVTSAIFDRCA